MTVPPSNSRKLDHIKLAMAGREAGLLTPGWDDVQLMPVALPQIDAGDVDLTTRFLGHVLKAPIMIAGMTGGHKDTEVINTNLAIAAEECSVAIGVGSQRAALADKTLETTYATVRRHAPSAFVCGNIGISQLVEGAISADDIARLIDMVEANAMAVHINVLQELVQPEGSIKLSQTLPALADFVGRCPVPVIVKETGCGLDAKTAGRLKEVGVAALDVGGAGGTSFVQIEGVRAQQAGDKAKARLAETFRNWGLPTTTSLAQVKEIGLPVIATGGIASGLDVAKALALGAHVTGVGRQMLGAALKGPDDAVLELKSLIAELTIAMVLTESIDVMTLRNVGVYRR